MIGSVAYDVAQTRHTMIDASAGELKFAETPDFSEARCVRLGVVMPRGAVSNREAIKLRSVARLHRTGFTFAWKTPLVLSKCGVGQDFLMLRTKPHSNHYTKNIGFGNICAIGIDKSV